MSYWEAIHDKARKYAAAAHAEQKYGDLPYTVHLDAVEAVVVEYFSGGEHEWVLRIGAQLHDTIEDTRVVHGALRKHFGDHIADLVYAVTDEPGINRRERKGRTYPKIRKFGSVAVYLKIADRIANWSNALKYEKDLWKMYFKEHWGFYGALYNPDDILAAPLWARMEELYFESMERAQK